jgi:hypothetical protein
MFQRINATLTLLPKVIAVVTIIEPLFNASVPGERKKQAALDALKSVGTPDAILDVASDLIDLVISVFNAIGVFKKADGSEGNVADEELTPEAAALKRATAASDFNLQQFD